MGVGRSKHFHKPIHKVMSQRLFFVYKVFHRDNILGYRRNSHSSVSTALPRKASAVGLPQLISVPPVVRQQQIATWQTGDSTITPYVKCFSPLVPRALRFRKDFLSRAESPHLLTGSWQCEGRTRGGPWSRTGPVYRQQAWGCSSWWSHVSEAAAQRTQHTDALYNAHTCGATWRLDEDWISRCVFCFYCLNTSGESKTNKSLSAGHGTLRKTASQILHAVWLTFEVRLLKRVHTSTSAKHVSKGTG